VARANFPSAAHRVSSRLWVRQRGIGVGNQVLVLPAGQVKTGSEETGFSGGWGREGFNCSHRHECSSVCPKLISLHFIALMNRDYLAAMVHTAFKTESLAGGGGA